MKNLLKNFLRRDAADLGKPAFRHSLYELTTRSRTSTSVLKKLEALNQKGLDSEYLLCVASFPLNERIDLMEKVYTYPSLFQKQPFANVILEPFTQGFESNELKYINLRLSYIYCKWLTFLKGEQQAPLHKGWGSFFEKHSQYYIKNWKENFPDYLLSLMYSYNALHHSEELAKLITEATVYAIKEGLPSAIPCRSDAHRVILQKIRLMGSHPYMPALYEKIGKFYFDRLTEIDEGKLAAITLELNSLYFPSSIQIDPVIKERFSRYVFAEIYRRVRKDPRNFDKLLKVLGNRTKRFPTAIIVIRSIAKCIKSFSELSPIAIAGYTRIISHTYNPSDYFFKDYIDALYKGLQNEEIKWDLYESLVSMRTLHNVPPNILECMSKMKTSIETEPPKEVTSKVLISSIDMLIKKGKCNPQTIKKILTTAKALETFAYNIILLEIGEYYANVGNYEDLDYWNTFLESFQDNMQLEKLNRKLQFRLYCIYFFLKENDFIDISTLVNKEAFDKIKSSVEAYIQLRSRKFVTHLRDGLQKRSIAKVAIYDPEYWYLPLALPDLKIAFASYETICLGKFEGIIRLLQKKGWKVLELPSKGFENTLEAENYLKEVFDPIYNEYIKKT